MRRTLLVMGALGVLASAGCGGSAKHNSAAQGSNQTAQGSSSAALIRTCISDYDAGDFGAISNTDGSSDPAPYCNCVIPSWLSSGDSAQKIADAMKSDASDSGGAAPIGFSQQSACSSKDPTINPNTGIPYS